MSRFLFSTSTSDLVYLGRWRFGDCSRRRGPRHGAIYNGWETLPSGSVCHNPTPQALQRRETASSTVHLVCSRFVIEHLGLIPAQLCQDRRENVTSFMRAAPYPNDNEIGSQDDAAVADPLADSTLKLWFDTARKNREIFTEVFRPVPTNLVRDWAAYDVGVLFPSFSQA
jgi:hypothetical protein